MDDLNLRLIQLLEEDGRRSYAEMASLLGVSEGTVRNRTEKLIKSGVIHIIAVSNPYRAGRTVSAMVGVTVQPGYLDQVAAVLASVPEARWVGVSSGGFDIVALVVFPSGDELVNFLSNTLGRAEGVKEVRTFMVLKLIKRGGVALEK